MYAGVLTIYSYSIPSSIKWSTVFEAVSCTIYTQLLASLAVGSSNKSCNGTIYRLPCHYCPREIHIFTRSF